MANGRNNNTIPLMGLLNQIERNEAKSTNQVGELMQNFESLAKQTDSVEGYENAKTNIQNLPDLNPFVKAKKDILLKSFDNEIKSQKVFDDLSTQISSLRSKVKKHGGTHSFEELISDMAFTIGTKKNMFSQQENVQLETLMQGLSDYENEAKNDRILKAVSATAGDNPNQISLDPKEQAIFNLKMLQGDAEKTINFLDRTNQEDKAILLAQEKASFKERNNYAGAEEVQFNTMSNMRSNLGEAVQQVKDIAGTDKFNQYLTHFRTEGFKDGKKVADPEFYLNQADKAADVIHGFIFGGKFEDDFLETLGDAWNEPNSKKDNQDRWKPEYVGKMINFIEHNTKYDPEKVKVDGFQSAINFQNTKKYGSEMQKATTDLWSKAVRYYKYASSIDQSIKSNQRRNAQAIKELQFEPKLNIMTD